ncbi:MAG: 16S rRNA (cytidine(1402)-2'-O)-methyltransferase [Candidatus Eisenbacteria bacterium]|nr:16S rRNA (cytidine(1402)-2'-O)-methyltransferase [Candidatus Eisenbacteria bacterium]
MAGKLYLVGTPIGNLEDITLRALRLLREADVIACEDTRKTRTLLVRHGISNKTVSYHEFNKRERARELVQRMLDGENVAVVSDAGNPGISDPAFEITRQAIEKNIQIVPVPGASSLICAVEAAGLPNHRFAFEGFLPRKKEARLRMLESLSCEERTMAFFESPHRLLQTLGDLRTCFGNRRIAICRELTKKFEEVVRGTLDECLTRASQGKPRGEFVLVVEGKREEG